MASKSEKSESCHIRIPMALIERIRVRCREENRTFNNACETLLYEAITVWENTPIGEDD